jgi:hypothetical protein
MPLLDPALLLLGQLLEYLPKVFPQLDVQRLSAALRNENNVVFAVPLAVVSGGEDACLGGDN